MMTPTQASDFILEQSEGIRVIPVLVIDDASIAGELAKILVDANIRILEVTLRTGSALHAIEAMAKVEGAIVAAGTVLNEKQLYDTQSAGAQFAVSPGFTHSLVDAASALDMPLLPGATTAAEVMQLNELGYHFLKFFPAEASGGVAMLKSLSSPIPQVKFCPTGGINVGNVDSYLALPNVALVGGSWLVTKDDLKERNWQSIQEKAAALSHL